MPSFVTQINYRRFLPRPVLAAGIALMCSSALLTPSLSALENLPDLGDHSASVVSSVEEDKLGREFMREVRAQLQFIDDPELRAYIDDLGSRLAHASDAPEAAFHFYLVQDNSLNAFAVPGGHVTVHTGLIMAAQHESELAAVLAHEIAHVTQHHLARMVDRSQQQNLPAMAALIAAILLGGQAGQAALIATNAKLLENQLTYTREFEREADAIGIQALARAGYDPHAMTDFFEKMEQWGRIQESSAPEFLRTHPLTTNRIAESAARADSYPPVARGEETDFQHARARIRALYSGNTADAVLAFTANLRDRKYESEYAERYGYALALADRNDYDAARREVDWLLAARPDDPRYRLLSAEVEMATGRYDNALTEYHTLRQKFAEDPVVELHYANALVKTRHFDEAKLVIKKSLRQPSTDPGLYELLARAEGESGNPLGAHQALAEYYYLQGNPAEALRQLGLARRYVGDSFYASASVDARIKDIEAEMRLAGQRPPATP